MPLVLLCMALRLGFAHQEDAVLAAAEAKSLAAGMEKRAAPCRFLACGELICPVCFLLGATTLEYDSGGKDARISPS